MSDGAPIFFSACRFALLTFNPVANGVSVMDGAMQLTLIWGASSAANDLVNPSMEPLELAITE